MTEDKMALVELLEKADDGDFVRAVAEAVLQLLMEADVEGVVGAGRHERSETRLNYRNGHRARSTPGSARSSCASRSCARARTSRPFWSRARLARRRWSRSFRRRG